MPHKVYPGAIMGRLELVAAECCGALFMDAPEAATHEVEHAGAK